MNQLRVDLLLLARHSLTRWLGLGLLVVTALRGLVWPPEPGLPWEGLWSFHLVATALIIMTAIGVGQAFSGGTYRMRLSRGVPRWQPLVSSFAALALAGGLFLVVIEVEAVLLGVRSTLDWGELLRAWPALWPYVATTMLLSVLARNGGLALVVGVILMGLEYVYGLFMGTLATIPEVVPKGWRIFTTDGLGGSLYQRSLSYNTANWIYLSDPQQAPMPANVMLLVMPRSTVYSLLVLALFVSLGLGLAVALAYRRDVTEVVEARTRLWNLPGRRRAKKARAVAPIPAWTSRLPHLARLILVDLLKLSRTRLVKIGVFVSLLFPLVLWGVARAAASAGLDSMLFRTGPEVPAPLGFVVTLMAVGPLATIFGILTVSNDLVLGTRRAVRTRGVSPLQTIAAQNLALMLVIGGAFVVIMAASLAVGASIAGTWYLKGACLVTLVAMLATGAYLAVVQVGGALTRSPLGAMLFGLGFLVFDWASLLAGNQGAWAELARYTVIAWSFALAGGGGLSGAEVGLQFLEAPVAGPLLVGTALAGTGLAASIAGRRDA
jgi:ABC-type transport system involved in multi-copper enzyme maturation permease subunit